MYIEPIINFENFLEDYHNGTSARDLKEKYNLTGRQYRKLCTDNNLTRNYTFLKQNKSFEKKLNSATYYSKVGNRYLIRKVFGTKTINYGTYPFEEIAKHIVGELKKVDWNKRKLNKILRDMKQEEWYMNLFNEKIRCIRTTIEAEQMKSNPNFSKIKKLEKDLKKLLKEVDYDGS